jgi:hypothetical protein
MIRPLAAALVALALAAPTAASADPVLGLRIGYAFQSGDAAGVGGTTFSQTDVVRSVVPLQADLGLALGPVELGGYFSYGFAKPPSACQGNCSATDLRLGAQAILHSPLGGDRSLWAGVLLGWQRTGVKPGVGGETTASGWEGGLQGGYDFSSSTAGFGPFFMLTVGEYGSFEQGGVSTSAFDQKFHYAFQLGARGHFRL